MARYLIEASYATEAIQNLVRNPQDRAAIVGSMAERWGGKLEAFYFAFGDYDVVAIVEVPDNVTMAAISMAISSSGALKTFKTTVLIPMNEAVEAMRKAGSISYQPPRGR
jgi:uncharacterized protein with GYD domain